MLKSITKKGTLFSALGIGVFTLATANAAVVFGTGVDNSGALTTIGTADVHFTLVGPSNNTITVKSDGDGHTVYVNPVSDGKSAQWISPGGGHNDVGAGDYTYTQLFSLTQSEAAGFQILGYWASDNTAEIFLNGTSTGIKLDSGTIADFNQYHPFSITSGFSVGTNTLEFRVNNAGPTPSPSALYVEIVPEPSSTSLLASFLLLGLMAVRRRR